MTALPQGNKIGKIIILFHQLNSSLIKKKSFKVETVNIKENFAWLVLTEIYANQSREYSLVIQTHVICFLILLHYS